MNLWNGTIHKNGEGADFVLASGQKLEIPKQKAEIMVERYHNKKSNSWNPPGTFFRKVQERKRKSER
mgnify:CR=1 FL=1